MPKVVSKDCYSIVEEVSREQLVEIKKKGRDGLISNNSVTFCFLTRFSNTKTDLLT
jgi:hypothetical protein